jgi:Na+-translocating ferredoxin:NAD+ oxidoreductase RnfG subunit
MRKILHLVLVLAIVAGVAGLALAMTFRVAAPRIDAQAELARAGALAYVFFDIPKADLSPEPLNEAETAWAVYTSPAAKEAGGPPPYYAAIGKGIGYNAAVPIEVIAGFTNPGAAPPEQGEKSGRVLVGFRVTGSEETPGLGEKIREERAGATWVEGGPWAGDESADWRTGFQRQFAGLTVDELTLKRDGGPIDVITSATYSTLGVISAIRDAHETLLDALGAEPETGPGPETTPEPEPEPEPEPDPEPGA